MDEEKIARLRCRAKEKGTRKWVEGFYVLVQKGESVEHRIYFDNVTGENTGQEYAVIDHTTLGQYTGIQDINGQRIFEDDVVQYRWTDERFKKNPKYHYGIVSWDKWNSGWSLQKYISCNFRSERLEVLGNIHDFPDWTSKYK